MLEWGGEYKGPLGGALFSHSASLLARSDLKGFAVNSTNITRNGLRPIENQKIAD